MKETYGVIGSGSAPKKVIEAGLNDIGPSCQFVLPWYGKVTQGLEVVYDWVLDNEAEFMIVAQEGVKSVPKALATKANTVMVVEDVDQSVVKDLNDREVKGLVLVLWDEDRVAQSVKTAELAINLKLPTLELTNGLVPIIFDEDEQMAKDDEVTDDELPDLGDTSYSRETLEMMPTALVKRMAKDKGFEPKSKQEAVTMLSNEPSKESTEVATIIIMMKDGTELGFTGNEELLKNIMDLVVRAQNT